MTETLTLGDLRTMAHGWRVPFNEAGTRQEINEQQEIPTFAQAIELLELHASEHVRSAGAVRRLIRRLLPLFQLEISQLLSTERTYAVAAAEGDMPYAIGTIGVVLAKDADGVLSKVVIAEELLYPEAPLEDAESASR